VRARTAMLIIQGCRDDSRSRPSKERPAASIHRPSGQSPTQFS
jgi:hypothetical protein